MRLTIPQPELAEAAKWAARQLPSKPINPVLLGLLLEAHGDQLTLSAFDGETCTRSHIDADISETGSTVLSARLLADITGSLDKTDVTITADDTDAQVETSSARFDLATLPKSDYPTLPKVPAHTGTVDGTDFAKAVTRVKMAVDPAADGSFAGMSGVRLRVLGDTLELTATDRYRIARHTLPWQPAGDTAEAMAVMPGRVVVDNAKTLAGQTVNLTIPADGRGTAGFATGSRSVTTMLIEPGLFPHRLDRLAKNHQSTAFFDAENLAAVIRQVATVNEGDRPIWLAFNGQHATVRARDAGSAKARIDAELEGDLADFEAAFNARWLLEGLAAVTGRVALELNTPHTPTLLHDPDDDTYSYVVIPIRDPHKAGATK